ncbi:C40 family peptidase [Actinacidiphila soli]|uniref:C40 family peptidase n=1 Tax=Actinacidiphila soli TaxID=2487275 RepID=UPI000FCBE0D2|nr:C40 family peptidase [Actinacidiphila soli]
MARGSLRRDTARRDNDHQRPRRPRPAHPHRGPYAGQRAVPQGRGRHGRVQRGPRESDPAAEGHLTLARAIDKAQSKLKTLTAQAGALAAAQYRSGGTGTLDSEPATAPRRRHGRRHRPGRRRAHREGGPCREHDDQRADDDQVRAGHLRDRRHRRAGEPHQGPAGRADAKKQITTRLAQAHALLATLQAQQKARLNRLEDEAAYQSQITWLKPDTATQLTQQATTATAQGRQAVAYVTAQLGKPYEWGAEGPRGFDCSGLTEQAWKAAGTTIPRTAEQQWRQLPYVPLARMRPGDLVVYYDDASHVAIYVGDGAIIQAPRPGRTVTVAGVGSMPILGVVRPGSTV